MLLYAPFDLALYRPIVFWAKLNVSWRFLRGDRRLGQFERNVRVPT